MVSGINTDELKIKTIKAGLHGFFPKTNHENELYQAINDVMNGKVYFKGNVGDFVIDYLLNDHLLGNSGTLTGFRFTPKELQYLRLVAEGNTNQAISVEWGSAPVPWKNTNPTSLPKPASIPPGNSLYSYIRTRHCMIKG